MVRANSEVPIGFLVSKPVATMGEKGAATIAGCRIGVDALRVGCLIRRGRVAASPRWVIHGVLRMSCTRDRTGRLVHGGGEGVDTFDEHGGGTSESDLGSLCVGGYPLVGEVVTKLGCQPGEHPVGVLPVGAVVEVEQGDFHTFTVRLPPWWKVKGIVRAC